MKTIEVQLNKALAQLWTQLGSNLGKPVVKKGSKDDLLWFAEIDYPFLLTLISNPDQFMCTLREITKKDIRLGKPFVVTVKSDQNRSKSLVQGISGTGLINVHLGADFADSLLDGLVPFLQYLPKGQKAQLALSRDKLLTFDPLSKDVHPEITIAAQYARIFTHVELAKGSIASTAMSIALFYGHLIKEPQKVADWLGACKPKRLTYVPIKDEPSQNELKIQYDAENKIPEILFISPEGARNAHEQACLCSTATWTLGKKVPLESTCVKGY